MQTCNDINLSKKLYLKSSKYGIVEYKNDDIVTMVAPIYGFNELKNFVLIDFKDTFDLIHLFVSLENPEIGFILLNIEKILNDFKYELSDYDMVSLKVKDVKELDIYGILTIPQDPSQTTINLKAPIFINSHLKTAKQIILENENLFIKTPLSTLKC